MKSFSDLQQNFIKVNSDLQQNFSELRIFPEAMCKNYSKSRNSPGTQNEIDSVFRGNFRENFGT